MEEIDLDGRQQDDEKEPEDYYSICTYLFVSTTKKLLYLLASRYRISEIYDGKVGEITHSPPRPT